MKWPRGLGVGLERRDEMLAISSTQKGRWDILDVC